jgi:putative transposase
MNTLKYKRSYRRRLPHIQPPNAVFFITSRLAGSLPNKVWLDLRTRLEEAYAESDDKHIDDQTNDFGREHDWFEEYEQYLHKTRNGPFWLKDDRLAAIVADALHHFDQDRYRLHAYCVMHNHIHVVLMPLPTTKAAIEAQFDGNLVKDPMGNIGYLGENKQFVPVTYHSLASIMHSIKRHTAYECNKLLGRTGVFWEAENYDRYVRSGDHWQSIINYTLNNPVKAGIVKEWSQYRWSWLRTG